MRQNRPPITRITPIAKHEVPHTDNKVLPLIRAARSVAITQRAALMFCCCFFLFFFTARSPRSLGRSPRNFATWSEMGAILKTRPKIWGSSPQNGAERCFWCDFGRLRSSIANISGKEQDIDNRKTALQTTISPASTDVIWWTLVHKRRTFCSAAYTMTRAQERFYSLGSGSWLAWANDTAAHCAATHVARGSEQLDPRCSMYRHSMTYYCPNQLHQAFIP